MEINDKNLNVNSAAFNHSNKIEALEFCPFCGAGKQYLVEETCCLSKEKKDELDSTTIRILDHGVKLELFNSDFYKKAAELAKDAALKQMFKDLARIEYMHARIHQKLGGFTEAPTLKEINYERYDKDEALLEQALLREIHAVGYYKKYMDAVCSNNIRKVLKVLESVEKEHITLLSN